MIAELLVGTGSQSVLGLVLVAGAQKVKGLAPLACKTDKIDSWVLAELSFWDLVPAIWLPTVELRCEREISRRRLHLVKHRSMRLRVSLAGRTGERVVVHRIQVGRQGRDRLLVMVAAGVDLPSMADAETEQETSSNASVSTRAALAA